MSLIAHTLINSSLSISLGYLDTHDIFGYTVAGSYTVDISDLQFTNEDSVLLTGREALKAAYIQQNNLTARLGGDIYADATITDISFSESSLVGGLQATIKVEESKPLSEYAGDSAASYFLAPEMLESFDETYDFTRNEDSYSYTRSLNIKYKKLPDKNKKFSEFLEIFLQKYHDKYRPNYGFLNDSLSTAGKFSEKFKENISENIDEINLSYSLEENFDASEITDNYSKKTIIKESIDERGYLFKEYNFAITAVKGDYKTTIQNAIKEIIANVSASEASTYGTPYKINKNIPNNSKKATLNVSFTTDPNYADSLITYTVTEAKNGSDYDYTVSAAFQGKGASNRERFLNSKKIWLSTDIQASALFSVASSVFLKSEQVNFDRYTGSIKSTLVYTDNEDYDESGLPEGILKYKVTVSKSNESVPRLTIVDTLGNDKQGLIVGSKKLSNQSVTAEAVADQSFPFDHGRSFLDGKNLESEITGTIYVMSEQYSINVDTATTTRVIDCLVEQT